MRLFVRLTFFSFQYRIILNGFSYAMLGIPTSDLEKPWYDVTEVSQQSNHSSTLLNHQIVATISHVSFRHSI